MFQTITVNKPRRIKPTTLAAIGFAAPLIIYMLIFYVWPLIQNISMSMHRYTRRTFVTGDAPWSGFDIYKEILSDQQFWTILGQTLIFRLRFYRFPILYRLGISGFLQSEFQTFRGFARRIPCTMATSANDFRYDLAMDDGRRQRCY